MALPIPNRLKDKKDFDAVFKKGKTVSGSFLFLKYLQNGKARPRFGFVVPLKVAPSAVGRNRIRRILAEAIWPELLPKMPACDTVVVATKGISMESDLLKRDFLAVLRKAKII
ncbi:MAG: ribonuclease P protein component [Candidatus Yanofskybacteria bacterium RIFCSPHIGHO2_01_FULL_48_25b]|uniref:Ribonuclease P protein component n=1 Tax=Candidatus Yanofskybacteria bacterium RIFCSPHIGHO2_01_FULL_48_25b TaxID=1802672 RepID=A0A1F8F2D9_9BACT|nr:MAG: ribonuclease P protein component [Candidatus Yanofskybacteria bacterium RIFCSPHIGHO2_01_FULL_48_25b]